MSIDSGGPQRPPTGRDIWRLPEVLAVEARRRRFDPPRRFTTAGVDRLVSEVVEVEVQLSEPFEIRALGPVLWVGDVPLTVAEGDDETLYRFLAPEPEALRKEAPVSLAWNASGAPRQETRFRYAPPE